MGKVLNRIFTSFLCLLLLLNVSMVRAEGFKLIINESYPDLFEFPASYNLVGGPGSEGERVQFLTVEGNGNALWSWCIEPSVATKPGSEYVNNNTILTNESVNNIVKNFYLNYKQDSNWKYYAVQVAIWAALANEDPASLATATWITDENLKDTVNNIRNLAHELWNSRNGSLDPYIKIDYKIGNKKVGVGETATVNLGNVGDFSNYYLINDQLYWKLPDFNYYDSKGLANVVYSFRIDVEDAIVLNYKNEKITPFEGKYPVEVDNNPVEIFIPIKENGTGASSASGQIKINIGYDYIILTGWDGSASNSQSMIAIDTDNDNSSVTFDFVYPIPVSDIEPSAELAIIKKGQGPYAYSTSTVGEETLYTIENREITLKDAVFEAATMDSSDIPTFTDYGYITNQEGKITISDYDTSKKVINNGRESVLAFVIEIYAPAGYYYDEDLNTYHYYLYENTEGKFVYEDNEEDLVIKNNKKKLTVNVKKENLEGETLDGVAFGLYTTKAIYMADGSVIPAGSLVDYGKTVGGTISLGAELPVTQNYVLKEISTIEGYSTKIEKITMDGTDVTSLLSNNGIELDLAEFISDNTSTKTVNFVVSNDKVPSNYDMKICKYSANDNATKIPGAKFKVTDFNKTDVNYTVTTESDGCVTLNIPEGSYTVEEVQAPIGYMENNTNAKVVSLNATTEEVKFYNYKKPVVEIYKKGSIDGVESSLKGSKFKIELVVSEEETELIKDNIEINNEEGFASVTLPSYGTYRITEKEAPEGYIKESTPKEVTLDSNHLIESVEFINYIKPELTIKKKGISSNSSDNLAGVKFDIYEDNRFIKSVITDSNGEAKTELSKYSTYIVKEVETDDGYVLDSNEYEVTFTTDKHAEILDLDNYAKPVLKINKKDGKGNGLSGAKFNIKKEDGTIIAENLVSDSNGLITQELPEYGKYKIIEIEAPDGYIVENPETETEFMQGINFEKEITVINHAEPELMITKIGVTTDSSNDRTIEEPLKNISFTVTYKEDESKIYTGVTDENGKLAIKLEDYGTYKIAEGELPSDCSTAEFYEGCEYIPIQGELEVPINSATQEIKIVNYHKPSLTIKKVDSEDENIVLRDAEFSIHLEDEESESGWTEYDRGTTDENGILKFENLPRFGKYNVIEEKAPTDENGNEIYLMPADNDWELTLTDYSTENFMQISNMKKPAITITKLGRTITENDSIDEYLEGVEFCLVRIGDPDEVRYCTDPTNDVGETYLNLDMAGTYKIYEISTPDEYIAPDFEKPIVDEIEIDPSQGNEITIYNYKKPAIKIKKTDDNGNPLSNATFEIYRKNEETNDFEYLDEVTSINGYTDEYTVGNFGTYYIQEVGFPDSYAEDETSATITITPDSTTVTEVEFENHLKPTLVITKVDKDDNNKKLAGAEFEISLKGKNEWISMPATDENGVTSITLDKYGTYEIKETGVPEHYIDENFNKELNITADNVETDENTNAKIYNLEVENTRKQFNSLILNFKGIKTFENAIEGSIHKAEFKLSYMKKGVENIKTTEIEKTITESSNQVDFSFPDLEITEEGTYVFDITETDMSSWDKSKDNLSYQVTVKVDKDYNTNNLIIDEPITWKKLNSEGETTGTVTSLDEFNADFTNVYKSSGSFALKLKKTFEANNTDETRPFEFIVKCGEKETRKLLQRSDTEDKSYVTTVDIDLTTVSENKKCTIKEFQSNIYDYEDYQARNDVVVQYDVKDNGQGLLFIDNIKIDGEEYTPTNSIVEVSIENKKFKTENFGFVIVKDIKNKASQENDEVFTFDVYDYEVETKNKTNRLSSNVIVQEGKLSGSSTFQFATNTIGDHYFYISEKENNGYLKADDRIINVITKRNTERTSIIIDKAEIFDQDMNIIEIQEGLSADKHAQVMFTNVYKYKEAKTSFNIAKTTNVRTDLPFDFTIKSDSENAIISDSIVRITPNGLETVSDDIELTFTEPGIYNVEITENKNTDEKYRFWTFDDNKYVLRYEVEKVNDLEIKKLEIIKNGKVIETLEENFKPTIKFENEYFDNTPVEVSFKVAKKVVSTNLKPAVKSVFKLKIEGTDETIEIKDGDVFTYRMNGLFNEGLYLFNITEINDGKSNYEYDDSVYQLRISVIREDNKLKPIVTLSKDGTIVETAEFINTYTKKAKPAVTPPIKPPVVNTGI